MKDTAVVLVTGASSGMGKQISETLLKTGYTVYCAARRVEQMKDLKALGGLPLAMDVTDATQVDAAIDTINAAHGGVDILINNAGFGMYGAMEDTSLDEARYQFEVNLFGPAYLSQKVLPHMRKQAQGRIINISSMGGKVYMPLGSWYHASKHALEGWSDCLRLELAPKGIDVVLIEPGIINTGFEDMMLAPMKQRSANGEYAALTQTMVESTRKAYANGSSPAVVAKTVLRAIKARKPHPRYATGKMAKLMIRTRLWLGDRLFDRLLMSQLR